MGLEELINLGCFFLHFARNVCRSWDENRMVRRRSSGWRLELRKHKRKGARVKDGVEELKVAWTWLIFFFWRGKQVWKTAFSFLISSCVFMYFKVLEPDICSQSFPTLQCIGIKAKTGKASDGTVPFCVLPSALPRSLTVKAWQHTQPSRSAVPHPGGPMSRTEKYTYETVHLRRGEKGKFWLWIADICFI